MKFLYDPRLPKSNFEIVYYRNEPEIPVENFSRKGGEGKRILRSGICRIIRHFYVAVKTTAYPA